MLLFAVFRLVARVVAKYFRCSKGDECLPSRGFHPLYFFEGRTIHPSLAVCCESVKYFGSPSSSVLRITALIRKERLEAFSFRFCFKVVLLSHIPFPLPGFEIGQVSCGEDSLVATAMNTW